MNEFIDLFKCNIGGLDAADIQPNTRLDSLPMWDSLAVLTVIGFVEEHFNRELKGPAVYQCQTIEDLYQLATKG